MTESRNNTNTITTYSNSIGTNNTSNPSGKENQEVKTTLNFYKAIENNNIEELINFLENESISKITLNVGMMKALQNFRSNSDMIDMIEALLNNNVDPNNIVHYKNSNLQISTQEKVTVLMYSCLKGDLQLVHTILKHHPNVNLKDSNNRNALFYSINADKGDNADIVLTLINSGINVNEPEKIGNTYMHSPLTLATQKNMKNTVKTLLENGADPNWVVEKDGNTALHLAVKNTNIEIIELLLQKGANLKIINNDNYTPLSLALKISNTDIYKIIVEEHNKQAKIENENVNNLLNDPNNNNSKDSHSLSNLGIIINSSTKNKKKDKKLNKDEFLNESVKLDLITSAINSAEKEENMIDIARKSLNNNIQAILNANNAEELQNSRKQANLIKDDFDRTQSQIKLKSQKSNVTSDSSANLHQNLNLNFNRKKKSLKYELINYLKEKKNLNMCSNSCSKSTGKESYCMLQKDIISYNSSNKYIEASDNLHLSIQIPFEFKEKLNNSNQFGSYISIRNILIILEIQSTPVLHLDLNDKKKEDIAILSWQVDELTKQLAEKEKIIQSLEENLKIYGEENSKLKNDLSSISDLIVSKEKSINNLQNDSRIKEEQYVAKISELTEQLEEKMGQHRDFNQKYERLEKELIEMASKNNICSIYNKSDKEVSRREILDKKFSINKYDDKYIIRSLQKDILDFQEYTKDQIKRNKSVLDELIRLVQSAVNDCSSEYEVKLYGSHATNLCLAWSDLDIVLVNKRTQISSNYGILQTLYLNLLDKPWKKTIKFIDTAVIPIIKITATEEYNSMQMDISLQDSKHYGLKCVELVKSYMNEYEALEPLIFGLKNLLKNANLNDPYTGGLSSYGLILMVVSYLQSQLESNKPIKIADGNIGRLFLEFLCYYGLIFDHTKYVIYTYPTSDSKYVDKDNNNLFFNMQSGHELIIVDPLNKSNNVARSTYQFVNIKMAFMIGFVVSREECECGCHYNRCNDDQSIGNSEHCILKRIFNSVKRFNANSGNQ